MYMLNPKIPASSPGLAIADVGTGTGVWLFEVGQRLPEPASILCGIDISDAQFPHHEWLPQGAHFRQCDALDPDGPPINLDGKFDIVHLRLGISMVKDNNPTNLIRFCSKLLKPGGHIQWDEMEPPTVKVGSYNGSAVEGMNAIMKMCYDQRPSSWMSILPQWLEKEGSFRVIEVDERVIPPWHRGWHIDNWCMLVDEFTERAEAGGPGINPIPDYYAKIPLLAPQEKAQGSWVEESLQIIVAQKT